MQPLYPYFVFDIIGAGGDEISDTLVEDVEQTRYSESTNPAVLVIDDEVFWWQLPASRLVEETAVHLLERKRGAPW